MKPLLGKCTIVLKLILCKEDRLFVSKHRDNDQTTCLWCRVCILVVIKKIKQIEYTNFSFEIVVFSCIHAPTFVHEWEYNCEYPMLVSAYFEKQRFHLPHQQFCMWVLSHTFQLTSQKALSSKSLNGTWS